MTIPLFTYWEGPKPEYIERCLASMETVCAGSGVDFRLRTPDNVQHYVPANMRGCLFDRLQQPAHRADYLRAALLSLHGGFYFDADTVGLKSPEHLATDHDLVYCVWSAQPRRVLNGYVYARPGSYLAAKWFEAINQKLTDDGPRNWTALGEGVLTGLVDALPDDVKEIPRDTFLPIDVDCEVFRFFGEGQPEEFIQERSVCFGLNHSWMMRCHRNDMLLDITSMRRSTLVIHRLLTRYTPNVQTRSFARN